jgi:subtilisin family serine protease
MSTDKIASKLQTQMRAAALDAPIGVIVRHKEGVVSARAVAAAAGAEVTYTYKLVPASAMRVSPAGIEALSQDPTVDFIWPDLPVHTWLNQSVPHINVPQVWDLGFQGEGMKIGVVDTGVDPTHPDFAGRIAAKTSFVGGDGTDDNGHGTHVCSIAAGSGAASEGKYRGVAPAASLYVAKVLDANGSGSTSGVMAGVEWAVDQGVNVINLSLGSDGACDGTDALSTLCDQAVQQHGVVVCVAAGNAGPAAGTVGSPGCARWVITVGAADDSDVIASFSSRGPTADGRIKPDILFPGVNIVAAQAAGTSLGPVVAPHYIRLSGTSMATPHATGSAALLLQAKPDLTPNQVKWVLLTSAVDLGQPANSQGSGRADVLAAYQKAISGTVPDLPNPPVPGDGDGGGDGTTPPIGCWEQIKQMLGIG